jgi:translation elongation factor EF-4
MDLEQEKGITIKLTPARMYRRKRAKEQSEGVEKIANLEEEFKK